MLNVAVEREARSEIRMVLCVSQPFSTKLYLALTEASISLNEFSFENSQTHRNASYCSC